MSSEDDLRRFDVSLKVTYRLKATSKGFYPITVIVDFDTSVNALDAEDAFTRAKLMSKEFYEFCNYKVDKTVIHKIEVKTF